MPLSDWERSRLGLALRVAAGVLAWLLSLLGTHFMLDRSWTVAALVGLVPMAFVIAFATERHDD